MQFRRIPGMTLPMPLVPGTEAMLTPPAAEPVDDESAGDLTPDDDTDCVPEGIGQPAREETQAAKDAALVEDLLGAVAGLILRVRELEALPARVRQLERALNDANNVAQVYEFRIAELEREAKVAKRERQDINTSLEAQVRSISEVIDTGRAVA